jgi:hypothetical protein
MSPDRAARISRRWDSKDAADSAYSSVDSSLDTALLTATNGTGSGTSATGSRNRSAAAISVAGIDW